MLETLNYNGVDVRMDIESEFEKHRFSTWLSKEPETITWIEGFGDGEIFYDIGANIGVYSLFAKAINPNLSVYAFEPAYHNFSKLCKNIIANGFSEGMRAYPVALNSKTMLENIELASVESGTAMHIMEGSAEARSDFRAAFVQGVASISLDDMVTFGLPVPHHIKIDTDGLEEPIITGAQKTLSNDVVRSVLIEISTIDPSGARIKGVMHEHGFSSDNPINTQKLHSRNRREKKGGGFENVIFTRDL